MSSSRQRSQYPRLPPTLDLLVSPPGAAAPRSPAAVVEAAGAVQQHLASAHPPGPSTDETSHAQRRVLGVDARAAGLRAVDVELHQQA